MFLQVLRFILVSAVVTNVTSDEVTFKNIAIQFQTLNYEEVLLDINATSLKEALPAAEVSRITVVNGSIPIIHQNAISDFPNLRVLQIRQHGIEEIRAGALRNLSNLEILRLQGNKIKQIQEGVLNNLNLVFLSLDLNLIEEISEGAFDNLTKLHVIDLSNNRIKHFYSKWLANKPVLSFMILSYNRIERLPDGALANYHKDIDFSNNRIQNLSNLIFSNGEKKVGLLNFANNNIQRWDEDLLRGAKIGVFDISGNKVRCLEGDLDNFFVASRTRINGNPWSCECLTKILSKRNKEKMHKMEINTSAYNCTF